MNILVINCGSSSIKFQLIEIENEIVFAKGKVGRIGSDKSFFEYQNKRGADLNKDIIIKNHREGIQLIIKYLLDKKYGVLESEKGINAVGHRVSHGGKIYSDSVLIDKKVINQIDKMSELSPLHNPHNLAGIKICSYLLNDIPQVAVFDTSFHQTIPDYAYLYGLPIYYYEKYDIRRYGFHGISHEYLFERASFLAGKNKNELKMITCHLGSGASITAINKGVSIDNSMGFTPLEGLIMGTRCGDIDPSIIPFLTVKENKRAKELHEILNNESGLLGLSGISNDVRDIEKAAREGNKKAKTTLKIFVYRVKKYIGAYYAALNGIDILVFSGGIGENDSKIRSDIINNMENLGFILDKKANKVQGQEKIISREDSKIKIYVIPTNEEIIIAHDTKRIVEDI